MYPRRPIWLGLKHRHISASVLKTNMVFPPGIIAKKLFKNDSYDFTIAKKVVGGDTDHGGKMDFCITSNAQVFETIRPGACLTHRNLVDGA